MGKTSYPWVGGGGGKGCHKDTQALMQDLDAADIADPILQAVALMGPGRKWEGDTRCVLLHTRDGRLVVVNLGSLGHW